MSNYVSSVGGLFIKLYGTLKANCNNNNNKRNIYQFKIVCVIIMKSPAFCKKNF